MLGPASLQLCASMHHRRWVRGGVGLMLLLGGGGLGPAFLNSTEYCHASLQVSGRGACFLLLGGGGLGPPSSGP